MFVRNTDTGKWFNQTDTLSKDIYENLKQDFEKTRLYSKCLSGATYLPINSFENIYNTFDNDKIGFYVREQNTAFNRPAIGPTIEINRSNSIEFYEKYLKENAFTIKNLFTPNKLIHDQLNNYLLVDAATTEPLQDLGQINTNYTIDGVRIVEGHRVLVKDQVSEINLSININPEVYFSTTQIVSEYFETASGATSRTFFWYNEQNGIYEYRDNKLIKTKELDSYDNSYRYSVSVKMGTTQIGKQFHTLRLKNGYFPISSTNDNFQFVEKKNWVLRNRVDYNNIYDLNFYDLIQHSTQSVFVQQEGRTYSIPPRTIVVGEFGSIINNQEKISNTATYSVSNIISNKFKVNLQSIVEVGNYYWCCGDEGTLLRISKHNFEIKKIDIDETSNLKSVSFFGDLYGKVVGDFNAVWWTNDGGIKWNKLSIPEFDSYSYNKVVYYDLNKTYVAGDAGVFIEFNFSNGTWFSYKRKVAKQLNSLDEFILVEDINDLHKTDWVSIIANESVKNNNIIDFGQNLIYNNSETYVFSSLTQSFLTIEIDSPYFGLNSFSASQFFGAVSIEDGDGINIYTNSNYSLPFTTPTSPGFSTWDFYLFNGLITPGTKTFNNRIDVSLPKQLNGNLKNTDFTIDVKLYYSYDALSTTTLPSSYYTATHRYKVSTKLYNILLLAANNSTVICYDIDRGISKSSNQFIYFNPTQSFSDVRTITRKNLTSDIFISGDKIYNFNFGVFLNSGTVSNSSVGTASFYSDEFTNRILFKKSDDTPYIVGNNSLAKFLGTSSTFYKLDPTFDSRIKSRLLFLDYDVASKLNFFTDDGQYRLPSSVTFSQSSLTQSLILGNISGENNWINYYKDKEKTFTYYSTISDNDRVEFSTTFSFEPSSVVFNHTIPSSLITSSLSEILPIAPSINSPTFSRFIDKPSLQIANQYDTNFRILLNKYLLIFKLTLRKTVIDQGGAPNVGDVLRLTSNVVDCNLVINRIEAYRYNPSIPSAPKVRLTTFPSGLIFGELADIYCYCYSDFNQNMIKNLQTPNTQVFISNLNKYDNPTRLVSNFESHPISIGYGMTTSSNDIIISPRFNNKTAYYNLQTQVTLGVTKQMKYLDSFLNFGYSPTYNILDYIRRIDNNISSGHKFGVMPEFVGLPGNNGGSFTNSNIFIDPTIGQIVATVSYYRTGTNEIIFGEDLKFYWTAIFLHTFVDLKLTGYDSGAPSSIITFTTQRLLVTKKYYRSDINGWVIEFHKKIEVSDSVANQFNITFVDIRSRNTLQQISDDLQLLNNIHRGSLTKSVQYLQNFTNLDNELTSKFPTDSYLKILACDYVMREILTGIIYTDSQYQLAFNVFNVESEKKYKVLETFKLTSPNYTDKLALKFATRHELKIGDLIDIKFYGGTGSSQTLNPTYFGYHTVIDSVSSGVFSYVVTSVDYNLPNTLAVDLGTVSYVKRDPFFNYLPIDLFDLGSDKKVSRAIEIRPENYVLRLDKYNLENVDLNRYRYRLVDGLSLEDISNRFPWLLEAEISNAIVGIDKDGGLVWYSGTWHCGRWFGGTWYSGKWISGDWYKGIWNSFNTSYQVISVTVDNSFVDDTASKWYNGRWFDGTWSGGTWYYGRRYAGEWKSGLWYDGIWNDGKWNKGTFEGGVWVLGTWEDGIFNCDSRPAYWLDGIFKAGDFENGIWYNGQFGNNQDKPSRFGTKSTNSRTSLWHAGKWLNGEFHSFLNTNSSTGEPDISEIHKYSIWRTGIWLKGDFYGGIAYNIDFRSGNWYGGILEEIQVIGVDYILPATSSTNSITLNGIFKFNPGDEIWIIDNDSDSAFSPIGNNESPSKYRINKILEYSDIKQTKLFLNYNLSSVGVNSIIASQSYSNVETGLRVISYFKDSYWKSGLWTNGIFDGGQFDSGIWYNGVFLSGSWGN